MPLKLKYFTTKKNTLNVYQGKKIINITGKLHDMYFIWK